MKKLCTLTLVMTMFSGPAFAAVEESDREEIRTVFDALLTDIKEGNYANFMNTMPPKVLDKMAEPMGLNAQSLKTVVAAQMEGLMEEVAITEMTYDLDGATTGTSDANRDYAIITTHTVMEVSGQKMEGSGPSLALEDEGKWYIVRIEAPQHIALIGEVYPDLADLDFPEATMEIVE